MRHGLSKLRQMGAMSRHAALASAVLAVFFLISPLAWATGGRSGIAAAAVSGVCCWMGAAGAMFVAERSSGPSRSVLVLLICMFLRIAAPLGLALLARIAGGPLADAGLIYYLLVFYPVTLALETWMSLPRMESRNPTPQAPEKLPS